MENNKTRTRFFAVSLAAALGLSLINTNQMVHVSAEEEEIQTEDSTDFNEPLIPDPEEELVSEVAEESQPAELEETQKPEPAELPQVESAESEQVPETMTVQALQSAGDRQAELNIQIKDTDGTVINTSAVSMNLGWIRDLTTIPESLELSGRNYTFKEVKYNNQTVVYTAEYNGAIYYSSNGITALRLPEGDHFDIIYWEYFTATINVASELEGVKPEDMASVAAVTEVLSYPGGTDKKLQKALTQETIEGTVVKARVYKGNKLSWKLLNKTDNANGSRYVVKEIEVNGTPENAQTYKNGGDFTKDLNVDSNLVFTLGKNDKIQIYFESGSIASTSPSPLEFTAGKSIKFSITLNQTGINIGDTFRQLYLKTINENGETKLLLVNIPENNNVTKTSSVGGYSISIKRSTTFLPPVYTYTFEIFRTDGSDILDDLTFVADDQSNAWNTVVAKFDDHLRVGVYDDNHVAEIRNETSHTVSLSQSKTFFIAPETGYRIDSCLFEKDPSIIGSLKYDGPYELSQYRGSEREEAIAAGYTHYVTVSSNGAFGTRYTLTLKSEIVPTLFQLLDAEGNVASTQSGTIESNKGPFELPTLVDKTDEVFAGWQLNESANVTFRGGDSFTINKETWNLGKPEGSGETTVQQFIFRPIFVEKDYTYRVEHYQQNEDGTWPGKPSVSYVASSAGVVNDVVLGIPEQFEGYHLDEAKTNADGNRGLQIKNGKPVDESGSVLNDPVIRLYYAKDMQYASLSILNHTTGDLANKNKIFTYQLTARPHSDNFPTEDLMEAGFTKAADSGLYVKSFSLADGESYMIGSVPISNCTYTVNMNTKDSFYTTTKQVMIDGQEQSLYPDEVHTTHTFDSGAMAPDAAHEVHFTHTASDVVPAGNLFDDSGFDLMLLSVTAISLIGAIHLVLKKRMQA